MGFQNLVKCKILPRSDNKFRFTADAGLKALIILFEAPEAFRTTLCNTVFQRCSKQYAETFVRGLNLLDESPNTLKDPRRMLKVLSNLREGLFLVPASPPVRFEGEENCVFLNGRIVTNFVRVTLSAALPCGFTCFGETLS